MGYGMTINCSMTQNTDDKCELGFHLQDSEGVDIDYNTEGEDLVGMIENAVEDILNEYYLQIDEIEEKAQKEETEEYNKTEDYSEYIQKLEERIELLQDEVQSLRADNQILQRRADDTAYYKKTKSNNYSQYSKELGRLMNLLGY